MKRENLEKLKELQEQLEQKKTFISSKKAEFDKSMKIDNDYIESLNSQITLYKQGIEAEALKEFEETGVKTLLGGVKVQEKKVVTLSYKPEDALKFAKEKDMFLMYDKKAFEKAAPSLGNLPWFKIETETVNKVTFPKVIVLEAIK